MAKNLEISYLLDFYGNMLTEKQRRALEYYYNEDLSLAEIAEIEGISRQGVRDSIKRAESSIQEMEDKLHLAERFKELKNGLKEIEKCAENINEYNLNHNLSREVNDNIARIKSLAEYLCE